LKFWGICTSAFAAMALKSIEDSELPKHCTPGDAWVAVDGDVYNVSKFAKLHPGGAKVLEHLAGKMSQQSFTSSTGVMCSQSTPVSGWAA